MNIITLLEAYRKLSEVSEEVTEEYANAIRIQRLYDSAKVIPMSLFLQGLGTEYSNETGYGMYLNKAGVRSRFISCLHPSYFLEFEGQQEIKKYPYVLWFEKEKKYNV